MRAVGQVFLVCCSAKLRFWISYDGPVLLMWFGLGGVTTSLSMPENF